MARTAHDPTTRWPARLALVLLALAPGCGPGSQRGAELLAGLRLPEDPLQEPRVSAAIDDAWRALVADPADARRWRRLAGVLDAHHHPEAARAGYRAALELEPGDVWTTYQLACLLEESGREPAEAARLLEAFLARRPEHVSALLRLAGVLRAGGREEEALAANRRATELAPRLAIAWRALGQTLVERGEGDEALAALRRAEALSPEPDGPTHAALARALQLTGAEEEARR